MMYRATNRFDAVNDVKNMLNSIYREDIFLPLNGIYDDKMKASVLRLQEDEGINPTGAIDYITSAKIYERYRKSEDMRGIDAVADFPVSLGDSSEFVREINILLSFILDSYGIFHMIRPDSKVFSSQTKEAVAEVRKIYKMRSDTILDKELYVRMLRDKKSLNDLRNI